MASDRLPKVMFHRILGSHPINETCHLCDGTARPEQLHAAAKEPLTADEAQALTAALGSPDRPTRKLPPRCDTDTDGCNYQEPHKHGFACDKTCDTCHGGYDDGCTCGATGDACHGLRCVGYGYPDLAESFAQLRRGEVKPARTFKEESRWTRLRIRLRWAKEAFFDDVD